MKYKSTSVKDAFVVSLEPRGDDRGFFSRVFCKDEFERHDLLGSISQINTSFSAHAYTLRGLHYQVAPHGESKLVKCIRGSIFDVVVDLREKSPTFGQWAGETLTSENRLMMYVPPGCAHGFLTLDDGTEVLYPASAPYNGQAERILRWDDPRFNIEWPFQPAVLSDKDGNAPGYDPTWHSPSY